VSIKQFRLSMQARDQLIRLKTRTGITHGTSCVAGRCACRSGKRAPPTPIDIPSDSNVELTWQVFGGEAQELYLAALRSAVLPKVGAVR